MRNAISGCVIGDPERHHLRRRGHIYRLMLLLLNQTITGLTVQGAGMHATTITGGFGPLGSVFTIQDGAAATLNDLTITGGEAPSGGGVKSTGSLVMQRDEVGVNIATGTASGGGADGYGGGVYSDGSFTMSDSAIVSNRAAGKGGGIFAIGATLTRDLIYQNRVSGIPYAQSAQGGGLWTGGSYLDDDTIAANQIVDGAGNSFGQGGAVFAAIGVTLRANTIANNSAAATGGVLGDATVSSTIIVANRGGDCTAAAISDGYNLTDGTCPVGGNDDILGQDPRLGPLADNGGPTQTMAIPAAKPADDASALCDGTDQRGVSLLQRGATRCDIGAYQVSAPTTYVANPSAASVTVYGQRGCLEMLCRC